jgi:hypothetical protein
MKSFQFTVFAAENGYRVRVKYGEQEYVWPDIYIYRTLECAGKEILKALRTARKARRGTKGGLKPPRTYPRYST